MFPFAPGFLVVCTYMLAIGGSVGNQCDFFLCSCIIWSIGRTKFQGKKNYNKADLLHGVFICEKVPILSHSCKCIDEHVNICLQIMAMIKTCNLGYMY